MEKETIEFIRSILPKGRTVFYNFPDRYALLLLEYAIGNDCISVSDLRKTCFSALLQKSLVKKILAKSGSGIIKADDLKEWWPARPEAFRLTLGTWPDLDSKPSQSIDQITRWGWNLVLQLNFASSHKRRLQKIVSDWKQLLEYSIHPIAGGNELTLAWSRIDLDLDTGEALIEEVQSDWIRDVKYYAKDIDDEDQEEWNKYFKEVLLVEAKKWPETMLTATIWFLLSELGLKHIFYHTHETGSVMKNIVGYHPPKSIYSKLPEKFCFRSTHNGPLFIRDSARRNMHRKFTDPKTKWYILDFNRSNFRVRP